jgi:hypothetical protein
VIPSTSASGTSSLPGERCALVLAGNEDEAAGGVHYVFSGIPIAFFNVALLTDRDVSAAALSVSGQRACDWAAKHGVPWLFVTTHEALVPGTDAGAALDACGLVPLMSLTGMIAQHVAPPSNVPAELRLLRPQDDDGCSALLDVNGLAYGMDLEAGKDTIGRQRFWVMRPSPNIRSSSRRNS